MGREPRAVRRWEKLIFYSARMTRTMTRFAQRQSTAAKEMQLLFPSTISADFQILDSLNSNSSHLPSTGRTKINCVSIWTCKRRNSKSANVFTKCVDFAVRALFSSLDVSTCSKLSQGGKITRYTFLASPPFIQRALISMRYMCVLGLRMQIFRTSLFSTCVRSATFWMKLGSRGTEYIITWSLNLTC